MQREKKLTHGADQNDSLDLWALVLKESSQQLHSGPPYMEVKLLGAEMQTTGVGTNVTI